MPLIAYASSMQDGCWKVAAKHDTYLSSTARGSLRPVAFGCAIRHDSILGKLQRDAGETTDTGQYEAGRECMMVRMGGRRAYMAWLDVYSVDAVDTFSGAMARPRRYISS